MDFFCNLVVVIKGNDITFQAMKAIIPCYSIVFLPFFSQPCGGGLIFVFFHGFCCYVVGRGLFMGQ